MKKNRFFWMGLIFLLSVVTASCGGSGSTQGAGGQEGGVETSGLFWIINSITPTDTVNSVDTPNVDVVRNDCSEDLEPFGSHSARVSTMFFKSSEDEASADRIVVTLYTLEYEPNTSSAPDTFIPALSSVTYTESFTLNIDEEKEVILNLFPIEKKTEYINKGGAPYRYPSYYVTIKLTGEDTFGNQVSTEGRTSITVGDFDNCD